MKLLATIKKELLEIFHDRTMLAVLLIFPVFVMIFMGNSFGKIEISGVPVGFTGPIDSSYGNLLVTSLNQSKAFSVKVFETETNATTALKNGQIRALITIPEDFEYKIRNGKGAKINLSIDNSDIAVEKSILAIISSVLQASSANITKTYVNAAWKDLGELNQSAGSLADEVDSGRIRLTLTKQKLEGVKKNISDLDIAAMENSINTATNTIGALQIEISTQKELLRNASKQNLEFLNQSTEFLANATYAVDEALWTVEDTHNKLEMQVNNLTETLNQLDVAISSAIYLRSQIAGSSCNMASGTIDLIITALQSMRRSTVQQISDMRAELIKLENLDRTLRSFRMSIITYSNKIENARIKQNPGDAIATLDRLNTALVTMNTSFNGARIETQKLRGVLSEMNSSITEIGATLDKALVQTDSVSSLIGALQRTVREQTSKNPEQIAAPLSVSVADQYTRKSFVDFIMPQVISVSLLFSCFLLASISLVREKTRRTIVRLLMVPGAVRNVIAGKIITIVLTSLFQVAIIILLGVVLFGVDIPRDLTMLVFGTVVSGLVLASIGSLIGAYSKTETTAIQLCLVFAIPMLFLGNIVFSADLLPAYTQLIQQFLPLAHITNIFKVVMITGGNALLDITALLTYFLFAAILLGYALSRREM